MKRREYIGKFLGDLAKIIFGTVIVGQFISDDINVSRMIAAIAFLIVFGGLSILIIPGDDNGS